MMHIKVNEYIFRLIAVVTCACCMAACSRDSRHEPEMLTVDDGLVTLALDASTIDATLPGSDDMPAQEQINNLRIIILTRDIDGTEWTVEHNDYISYDYPVLSADKRYKVKMNARKRVYLMANCAGHNFMTPAGESLDMSDGPTYLPSPATGWSNAPVSDAVFVPTDGDMSKYGVPMSGVSDDILVENKNVTGTYYLVRAVNKLSLTVENAIVKTDAGKDRRIKLNYWTIDKVADKSYIMPHVKRSESGYRVIDTDRETELYRLDWVKWLIEETDKKAQGDILKYQWFPDYSIPTVAAHESLKRSFTGTPVLTAANPKYSIVPVYFAESKNEPSSLGLQKYRFTLQTEEQVGGNGEWFTRNYSAELPQLATLFRDTHVKITASIGRMLIVTVDEQPYASVDLTPIFGLDEPKPEEENNDNTSD